MLKNKKNFIKKCDFDKVFFVQKYLKTNENIFYDCCFQITKAKISTYILTVKTSKVASILFD